MATVRRIHQMLQGRRFVKVGIIAVGLSVIAGLLPVFVPQADAAVCPPPTGYKSIGGTCYSVKGVLVDTTLKFTGNLARNPKSFKAEITPIGSGILFCGNAGGNQAPGQRIVPVFEPLSCGPVKLLQVDVDSSQNGGTAEHVLCEANLSTEALDRLGHQYCSAGQFAIDFVPCDFTSQVTYMDNRTDPPSTIETAKHVCTLPSCETLRWDNKLGRPEPRQYDCQGPVEE